MCLMPQMGLEWGLYPLLIDGSLPYFTDRNQESYYVN